jgi:hypothetical protein
MQTQQCNGSGALLISINASAEIFRQRFFAPLGVDVGVHLGVHVALHSDRLAQDAAKAKTVDALERTTAQPPTKNNGRNIHGMPLGRKTPGRPAAESTSSELLKLVHKLRWAGMEEEAERLLKKLKHGQTPPKDSVVATPTETD